MVRIQTKVNINLDRRQLARKAKNAVEKAQFVLDEQILKDSNFYIPMDTAELMRSSLRASRIGSGLIAWNTPYARRLYYNPQYDFSKDENPNAQGLWFEAAKATLMSDWVKITERAYKEAFK